MPNPSNLVEDSNLHAVDIDIHQTTIIKRNGEPAGFDAERIHQAIRKALLAVADQHGQHDAQSLRERASQHTDAVVAELQDRHAAQGRISIETIQDIVELTLMRAGEHEVARAYILYREQRQRDRSQATPAPAAPSIHMTRRDCTEAVLDINSLRDRLIEAARGLDHIEPDALLADVQASLYQGIAEHEVEQALLLAARARIEVEPSYSRMAARLLNAQLSAEVQARLQAADYAECLIALIHTGIEHELLDERLRTQFDLEKLAAALQPERDEQFGYLGLQTLYDRYFIQHDGVRIERPQTFFMRVAMGLAIAEDDPTARAIEFYEVISCFDFMCSTPTLFNAGTNRSQLSSCYLTTVDDDLRAIYGAIADNAMLSKFAGGLGNDWTPVRALGAHIKGTNGASQGVVPFLKVVNDTAVAVNQGGKRKGAVCAYLETWHLDIESFLELRKNTGDDRRRTHDMNTANWIPDLFMQRVAEGGEWTLFSPDEVPALHDTFGETFRELYEGYEAAAAAGEIRNFKTVSAVGLWRKMLTQLFETGHPWITFKDACNLRSPQQHVGVVHSSNLCTEITLNTSAEEIAVCNLGSINLVNHLGERGLDEERVRRTVGTAMRMLDNVIDINYYSVPQAERSNLRHRPVGLGMMGFQDALYRLGIPYASVDALNFADASTELISHAAISASNELAQQRGCYDSYVGSLWDRGIFPIDSIALLEKERGEAVDVSRDSQLDWSALRESVKQHGMRNSNCLAIAPTATIANICGVSASIEPSYRHLFVKSNLSGEFTVVNEQLVAALRERGLWDRVMSEDLKYFDGSLAQIERVPDDLKALFATAFEIDPSWLVDAGARRQKWLDQAQSLNLYLAEPSGPKIDALYRRAWQVGLKTTYYLRTLGATHVEKSTTQAGALNAVSNSTPPDSPGASCAIDDPDCEACQ